MAVTGTTGWTDSAIRLQQAGHGCMLQQVQSSSHYAHQARPWQAVKQLLLHSAEGTAHEMLLTHALQLAKAHNMCQLAPFNSIDHLWKQRMQSHA